MLLQRTQAGVQEDQELAGHHEAWPVQARRTGPKQGSLLEVLLLLWPLHTRAANPKAGGGPGTDLDKAGVLRFQPVLLQRLLLSKRRQRHPLCARLDCSTHWHRHPRCDAQSSDIPPHASFAACQRVALSGLIVGAREA